MVADRLCREGHGRWRDEARFQARLAEIAVGGARCWLCQPLTYMNASGEAVGAVKRYHRIADQRLLVLVDDADLPLGEIRLRPEGGSGGHHGLESVELALATREYARLRLGIGRRSEDGRQIIGYVLGQFGPDEGLKFEAVVDRACAAVECWVRDGVTVAMNRYNGALPAPETKDS